MADLEQEKDYVTMVEDPFGIKTLDISQAQENEEATEEQPEDEAPEETSVEPAEARPPMDLDELQSSIEMLLFISDKPLSSDKLHELVDPRAEKETFREAMRLLQERYSVRHHGLELVEVAGGFQFRTKLSQSDWAKKLAKVQTQRLSSGAMESLAIIAYKQPVMKEEIDKIRGVDSSYFIRGLMDKKLIEISGRSELPGRPMLYSTTREFLELFGLKDLSSLPSLRELEQMIPLSQAGQAEGERETPQVREMRKLVNQMNSDESVTLTYDPKEDEKILKDIRERVNAIQTITPSLLDEQKQLKEQQALETQV